MYTSDRKPRPTTAATALSQRATSPHSSPTSGVALPVEVRSYFEPRFGQDFSKVRVHADAAAAQSALALQARAYTSDETIVFGAGQYCPTTATGQRLLAHELAHVVQQRKGEVPASIQRAPDFGAMYRGKDGKVRSHLGQDFQTYKAGLDTTEASSANGGLRLDLSKPLTREKSDTQSQDAKDLRAAVAAIKADPRQAANPQYAFMFSAAFMKMADDNGVRGDVKASQGQVTSWMGKQPAAAKKDKLKAYAKAYEVLAAKWHAQQGYGYEFADDPLNAGGFGPNDATIRVRPSPIRTTLLRRDAPVQRKALVGAVNHPLEREADAMAARVLQRPEQSQQLQLGHDFSRLRVSATPNDAAGLQRRRPLSR